MPTILSPRRGEGATIAHSGMLHSGTLFAREVRRWPPRHYGKLPEPVPPSFDSRVPPRVVGGLNNQPLPISPLSGEQVIKDIETCCEPRRVLSPKPTESLPELPTCVRTYMASTWQISRIIGDSGWVSRTRRSLTGVSLCRVKLLERTVIRSRAGGTSRFIWGPIICPP